MARIEAKTGQQQPRFSLREEALLAVDGRILEHPFYTGVNAAVWGIATPIDRKEAEEMFEGTTVVLRDPETVKKGSRRGESTYWRNLQKTWKRNYEAAGAYFGTGATDQQIAERFFNGRSKQLANQSTHTVWNELLLHAGGMDLLKRSSEQEKPRELWHRREELVDGASRLSRLLQAVENGKTGSALNQDEEFGGTYVSAIRAFFSGTSINIPYEYLMTDPAFVAQFEKLDEANVFRDRGGEKSKKIEEEKERIMKKINRGTLQYHGKEKLHVASITSVAEHLLNISPRDIPRIVAVLRREGVFVHAIPNSSGEKRLGLYCLIANGDIAYALGVLNLPEFDNLRRIRQP